MRDSKPIKIGFKTVNSVVTIMKATAVFLLLTVASTLAQWDPHYVENRTTMVHLMDWKYADIAAECERFLGPRGYGGIQLSPVSENIIVPGRPWWERYQPISYKLTTRSGDEQDFLDMTRRCNAAGVRIYIDIILNHMSREGENGESIGTGGSTANPEDREFPAVPYGPEDFNQPKCDIHDWGNPTQIRDCNLLELEDLDQRKEHVRDQLVGHLDHLIDLGVAGFRVDAAKHMWPADLDVIYGRMKNLNTEFGFAPNSRPFVFQEVIDYGGDVISRSEYEGFGAVTDFKFSMELGRFFRRDDQLKWLVSFGPSWGLLESKTSFCFVDNHDNQRDHGSQLTYKDSRPYKMVSAFALAHPHGHRRLMSSFAFEQRDQGPPFDANGNIISPIINPDNSCGGGWICEHRWRQIYNMVDFRNVVGTTSITNWWDNGNNQIAFGRGDRGFIVFNNEASANLDETLKSDLPTGRYCDVISGNVAGNQCSGIEIRVGTNGFVRVVLPADAYDGVIAIHVGPNSRLET